APPDKAGAPAAAEEGDAADADGGRLPRAEDPGDPEDRRRADQQDAPSDHGHPGRRSPEAGLHVPPRRALRREAALQLQPGARARSEDLRAAAQPARS